jgi:hypothetical protein
MVSGCVTSPWELSRIDSGEAREMVIFEKSLLIFLFFLKDMLVVVFRFSTLCFLAGLKFDVRVSSLETSKLQTSN